MQRRRFGAASKCTIGLLDQISFFNKAKGVARKAGTGLFPSAHRAGYIQTAREERISPECAGFLHHCGQKVLRRELGKLWINRQGPGMNDFGSDESSKTEEYRIKYLPKVRQIFLGKIVQVAEMACNLCYAGGKPFSLALMRLLL